MTERMAELERRLEAARAEVRRLRKIVETGDDIISLLSAEQVTTYITPNAFEVATGIPVEKHRGTNAFDWLHPEDRPRIASRFAELVAAGAGAKTRVECRHLRADGSWTWIESVACNMLGDPDVGGVVVISRIIDDAVRLRDELRTVNERYVIAQRISREAVWERNLIDDTMVFSPAASQLLGYGSDVLPTTVQQTFPLLHPDDIPAQQIVIDAALRGEAGTADSEARIRHQSGEFRWIRIHRQVQWDSEGRPARIIAHATDIHDRKVAESRLLERSRRDVLVGRVSRLLVDGAPSAVEAALVVIGAHFESSRVSVQCLRSPGVIETLAVWTPNDARRMPPTHHVDDSLVSLVLSALQADQWIWARGDDELSSAVRAVQGAENAEALSALILPLVDQRVVGWIALEHTDASWALSQEDVALIRLLAEILSIAHARSQAENRTRLAAMRDELIGEISRRFLDAGPEQALDGVLERVGTTLEFERVSVFAPDGEGRRLTCTHRWMMPGAEVGWESLEAYPVPPGAFEQLSGSGDPAERSFVRIDDWLMTLQREAGTRTLQAPIGYGGRVFGLLVARMRPSRVWHDDDALTLKSVGEVVALARVRRAAELALAEAKEAAVAASAAKSSFLANMSHELRTPLNGVIGMVDLLAGTPLDEHQQRFCDVARSSAKSLLAVINDVLDFSKIEANKLELDAAPFDLRGLIDEVVEMLALQAQSSGLALVAKTDPAVALVVGDAARVRQVLVNLVSNAVKFTSKGSVSVRSRVTKQDDELVHVRVEVEDTGIGLPPDAERRLFKPFSQLDGSFARRQGGTGLGLAISRDLVERMGGRIGVTGELGRGSTFWFEVPFARASSEASRIDGLPGMRAVVVSEDEAAGPLAGRRVLVVEDSPVNALVTTELLRRAGAEYELAESGVRAIELSRSAAFDLVLMDCHLPDMDGYETTRRLRAQGLQTPIVALTANATTEDLARCFAAGMNDRVVKPVDARRFVELLARHIEERAVPEATASRVFDAVAAIERMRGDRDLFTRVCIRFREIASGDRRALSAAVQARDARAALALAHRLRGQAGAIGGHALMDALVALESVAGEARWSAASATLLAVEAELDKLLLALAPTSAERK